MSGTGRDYLAPEHFYCLITRLKAILLQCPCWGGSSVKTMLRESESNRFTLRGPNFYFHCLICRTTPFTLTHQCFQWNLRWSGSQLEKVVLGLWYVWYCWYCSAWCNSSSWQVHFAGLQWLLLGMFCVCVCSCTCHLDRSHILESLWGLRIRAPPTPNPNRS